MVSDQLNPSAPAFVPWSAAADHQIFPIIPFESFIPQPQLSEYSNPYLYYPTATFAPRVPPPENFLFAVPVPVPRVPVPNPTSYPQTTADDRDQDQEHDQASPDHHNHDQTAVVEENITKEARKSASLPCRVSVAGPRSQRDNIVGRSKRSRRIFRTDYPKKNFHNNYIYSYHTNKSNYYAKNIINNNKYCYYSPKVVVQQQCCSWPPRQRNKYNNINKNKSSSSSSEILPFVQGDDKITTLMIRNIPNKFTRKMMLDFLDKHCMVENQRLVADEVDEYTSAIDFLYLPIDFKTNCNKGYAFVNFTCAKAASKFSEATNNQAWAEQLQSRKIREIARARLQGMEQLVRHFEQMGFPCDNEDYLPVCFSPPRDGSNDSLTAQTTVGKLIHKKDWKPEPTKQ